MALLGLGLGQLKATCSGFGLLGFGLLGFGLLGFGGLGISGLVRRVGGFRVWLFTD